MLVTHGKGVKVGSKLKCTYIHAREEGYRGWSCKDKHV